MGVVAVLVAALAGFAMGAVWYMALSKPWIQAAGIEVDETHQLTHGLTAGIALQFGFVTVAGFELNTAKVGHHAIDQVIYGLYCRLRTLDGDGLADDEESVTIKHRFSIMGAGQIVQAMRGRLIGIQVHVMVEDTTHPMTVSSS